MKRKIIYAVCLLSLCIPSLGITDVEQKPQNFKVTYEITYNSITLERAAELESLIKSKYKDACTVNVNLEREDEPFLTLWDSNYEESISFK